MNSSQIVRRATPSLDEYLLTQMEGFLIDRKARGASPGTLRFYDAKLRLFAGYCESQAVTSLSQVTPALLRQYLIHLEGEGHNAGGRHAAFRTVRAFLNWYELEAETWANPLRKVKAPRVPTDPLDPVPLKDVTRMVGTCERGTLYGDRDAAILLSLLDTGARAAEFLAVDLEDISLARGDILIRSGKGGKPRVVFIGRESRRAIRRYLAHRRDDSPALWYSREGGRLTYGGLRAILTRRAEEANVPEPSLHSFRRAFALAMLRAGTDIFTLARLMGHSGIGVLQRYLKENNADTLEAHRRGGPVDHLRNKAPL